MNLSEWQVLTHNIQDDVLVEESKAMLRDAFSTLAVEEMSFMTIDLLCLLQERDEQAFLNVVTTILVKRVIP